ncbi:MAG: hypothetical protein DYG96_13605, partial [Chlorobi bacterium CHB2]|nr:hypothetical protein [Chlorobi bacterium CHB2]
EHHGRRLEAGTPGRLLLELDRLGRRVQAHDGDIRVESEPGQGSTFVVRIPLLNPTPQNEDMAITPPRHRTLAQTFDVKRLLKKTKGSDEEKKGKEPAAEEPKPVTEPEEKAG